MKWEVIIGVLVLTLLIFSSTVSASSRVLSTSTLIDNNGLHYGKIVKHTHTNTYYQDKYTTLWTDTNIYNKLLKWNKTTLTVRVYARTTYISQDYLGRHIWVNYEKFNRVLNRHTMEAVG
jgi:hypothetical protein